jgi:hypothetical protein
VQGRSERHHAVSRASGSSKPTASSRVMERMKRQVSFMVEEMRETKRDAEAD